VVTEGRWAMTTRADAVEASLGAGLDITDSGRGQVREIATETAVANAFHEPILGAARTSGYGWRWGRMHNGLDFGADIGTPLYAVARGTVTTAGWNSGLGYHVKIALDTGEVVVYGHMSRIITSLGDRVEAGTVIGEVGTSGRSTGAHLHFEVRTSAGPVDPALWLAGQPG
jgi:murein DD-endopeptidase MepM/ murein hydrolase activator NlpD